LPPPLSDLRYGRIVEATFTDHNGFQKQRPAIILTPTEQITVGGQVVLMAITTTFADPPPADHIPLPWNPDSRRVSTRLARRSAAVVNWLAVVTTHDILGVRGQVPTPHMARIQQELQRGIGP
jgi:mRNA-degrading endonuclease toxin of MazEF toxin-antitoxin module